MTSDTILLPATVSQDEVLGHVARLNADPNVSGILVQMPLPKQVDEVAVMRALDARKDVDGLSPTNLGLLLQGDIKAAEYAFKQVTVAEPEYADGWLNVARALIQEGETDAAKPYIAEALKRDASLGRIHFFKAMIEKADGDYQAALASLKVVIGKYPRDRVALNQVARVLFLERQYAEAVTYLERVARIDPEDLQMHYTAMLVYRGLGNADLAEREAQLFTRFKAEEAAQAITGSRRLISPEDNNERQQIHEHEGVTPDSATSHVTGRQSPVAGHAPAVTN